MKFTYYVMAFVLLFSVGINAQQTQGDKASYVGQVGGMTIVPSLASRSSLIPAVPLTEEPKDGRSSKNLIIPGKDPQAEDDYLARNAHPLANKIPAKAPELVFEVNNTVSSPSDPSLAVGPDHVFIVYNTGFIIYDTDGNDLTGPSAVENIFSNGGCCDLTVSYDNAADRWVVSYLFVGAGAEIAVSDGPDPITSNWFLYSIPQINDYQKLSVWSDGYYMTDNTGSSNKVWAMERDEMLLGNPAAGIQGFDLPGIATSGFFSPQALNVTDDNLPAAGSAPIIYLQDDAWAGVTEDHIKIWTVDVDWVTPANSTISAPVELTTTPFISVFDGGSFSNLQQPAGGGGQDIDALQATIMNQAQFRKFGSHNSALFNFVIDVDATAGEKAAVRWYELRQPGDGQPWTIFQEGTYTAPDTPTGGEKHAWHASLMMDASGNIGMGYSGMTVDPNDPNPVRVSSYYTGRFASDPLGTMTVAEEEILIGDGNIPGFRYGDYSKIDLDPDNDKEFWFINELRQNGGANVVGVFQIAPDFNDDTGAVSIDAPNDGLLTATEQVTVTLFNFGLNQQSNIPVSLTVDGNLIANEVFAGPLDSATSAQYTFTATVDMSTEGQTYTIEVATNLSGDEDNGNDATTKDVTHIFANDLGVTEITEPESGEGLGNENVTVTIENFGGASQSNFDVSYTVDTGTPVVETVPGPLDAGMSMSYTFGQTANLSAVGTYDISSSSELTNDAVPANNTATKEVSNLSCLSQTNDTNFPIGPNAGTTTESIINYSDDFTINDVNVTVNLDHTYTGDLDIFLIAPDNTTVQLFDQHGGSGDNLTNTVFDDEATDPIAGASAPFTGTFQPVGNLSDFDGLQTIGDWTLRIVDNLNGDGGQLLDWTLQLCGDNLLGTADNFVDGSELVIVHKGNNLFNITLPTTQVTERLTLDVINMLGQKLVSYRLDNENGTGYEYDLDMSYVSSGVYIVRLGTESQASVKRLIVR